MFFDFDEALSNNLSIKYLWLYYNYFIDNFWVFYCLFLLNIHNEIGKIIDNVYIKKTGIDIFGDLNDI